MKSREYFSLIFRMGVRQKVMVILLLVLLTALTVSGWMAFQQEKEDTLKEINQRGSDISRFVAKSLAYSVVGYDYHTIQLLLDEITLSDDVGYAKVISKKGGTMAESGEVPQKNNENLVLFNQDIKLEDEVVGHLVLGLSTAHTIHRLESQKYSLFKREAFIILLIAFGEFLALSFIIIRPVSVISSSLNNSVDENGRIIAKVPVISNDEFGQLAASFNNLSAQLNEANERLQSKIHLADKELIKTNRQLVKQSEELRDISENLKKMSVTDELTGLYNRRRFDELMKSEMDMSHRYGDCNSILIIDIDHFKKINDNYGHPCGDSVLKDVSALLKSKFRKTDILCRIGGEEFVALCKRADKHSAMVIAENLRKLVETASMHYGDTEIKITISVGIATVTNKSSDRDRDNLYRYADIALYHSKDSGRNRITHYDDLNSSKPKLEPVRIS
jgi:diguanylate cyclase (GGDEF)-like protein